MFEQIEAVVGRMNGILFSQYVVFALLIAGVLFTIWSGFGQYRALTHGVQVVRGKYDDKDDPGAINHFQALSTALSATVGLGNIAGVAVAVAVGGPGAILWMWVIGVVGMALKMTEVTQSMLYRNTEDRDNPHGGPMFVVKRGIEESLKEGKKLSIITGVVFAAVIIFCGVQWGGPIAIALASVFGLVLVALAFTNGAMMGSLIGGIFVVTLIVSAITGGNMFQAWNVADVTHTYFKIPTIVTGIVLASVVGLVIVGGIKRIGAVTGRLVPFMCVIYMLAAGYVLLTNLGAIPAMLGEIVSSGLPPFLGGSSHEPGGAFMGGAFGFAAMWGVKRALFSSEAGQGSAPIAHSAAKTDEPVREGVVAGLEPFIDTLVVCTLTALVIMSSGAWNRGAEASSPSRPELVNPVRFVLVEEDTSLLASLGLKSKDKTVTGLLVEEDADSVTVLLASESGDPLREFAFSEISVEKTSAARAKELERIQKVNDEKDPDISTAVLEAASPYFPVLDQWTPDQSRIPGRTTEAKRVSGAWEAGDGLFVVVDLGAEQDSGFTVARLGGTLRTHAIDDDTEELLVSWAPISSHTKPVWREEGEAFQFYGDYAGASLTAHAFDRVTPGLGQWLVSLAAWLFALSTMISWAYYGEQGIVYLAGEKLVLPYKLVYCGLIVISTLGFIKTDTQLDNWTTLGLGVMLVANIPIMLIFGSRAMSAYHEYMKRLKSGTMESHKAPSVTDVVEGKDVE